MRAIQISQNVRLRVRRVLVAGLACMVWLVMAPPARAAVTWGPTTRVGPFSTWNPGNALARAGGQLIAVWSSDCPPPKGTCASDPRPTMGVFVHRSRTSPVRWMPALRLSPKRVHAERASVAAEGQLAIAGWVTQTSYRHYRGSAPRQLFIRRSGNRGGTWSAPVALTPRTGRVDYPQLAVAGAAAYAVWTDANTGAIRLATSVDGGRTWLRKTVGTTTSRPIVGEGFAGYPSVGASGTNLVIAWNANPAGGQVALTSTVRGADLGPGSPQETLVSASPNDGFHYAVAKGAADGVTNDVAIAFTTATGVAVRVFDGATLRPQTDVVDGWPLALGGRTYTGASGPVAQPFGSGGLTVAFAGCVSTPMANDCRSTVDGARLDVFAANSPNGGANWTGLIRLAGGVDRTTRINEAPSLAVAGPGQRFVMWNARDEGFLTYRVLIRAGIGLI